MRFSWAWQGHFQQFERWAVCLCTLRFQFLGVLNNQLSKLVGVINTLLSNLVGVINTLLRKLVR